jgi:hypothetical protein
MRILRAIITLTLLTLLFVAGASGAMGKSNKVTICHAAGLDGTTKFVELTISENAVYGPAGHFYENGTPRAGHEQDYLGPCEAVSSNPPVETFEPKPTPDMTKRPFPSTEPTPVAPEIPNTSFGDRPSVVSPFAFIGGVLLVLAVMAYARLPRRKD